MDEDEDGDDAGLEHLAVVSSAVPASTATSHRSRRRVRPGRASASPSPSRSPAATQTPHRSGVPAAASSTGTRRANLIVSSDEEQPLATPADGGPPSPDEAEPWRGFCELFFWRLGGRGSPSPSSPLPLFPSSTTHVAGACAPLHSLQRERGAGAGSRPASRAAASQTALFLAQRLQPKWP